MKMTLISIILIPCLLFMGCDDSSGVIKPPPPQEPCDYQIAVPMDVQVIFTVNNNLYGIMREGKLYRWNWDSLIAEPNIYDVDIWDMSDDPRLYRVYCGVLGDKLCKINQKEEERVSVKIYNLENTTAITNTIDINFEMKKVKTINNGKYLVILTYGYDYLDNKYHAILFKNDEAVPYKDIAILANDGLPSLHSSDVSNDDRYLAIVGTYEGGWIAMYDLQEDRYLWEKRPQPADVPDGNRTVNFRDVCFSKDDSKAYVAGNSGAYCFDVATGKIISQWGQGGFINVDVSPDGRYVAFGASLTGVVEIYATDTGKLVRKIETGQWSIDGLTFSPDSTRLATSGNKRTNIKIWNVVKKKDAITESVGGEAVNP